MSQKPSIIVIILAIIIFGFLAVTETVSAAPDTLTLQVGNSWDDARVRNFFGWGISVAANSGFIGDEGFFGGQQGGIGMRFTNVDIPPGSVINSAVLQLRAHQNNNQVIVRSKIRAEDTGDAQTFSNLANYQARPTTTAEVAWDGIGAWTVGTWYDSPDIKDVIQAVVNRADWVAGNAMVIFFDDHDGRSDNGARRNVSLYDSNPAFAPRLIIEYTPYERCVKSEDGWNSAEEDCCIEVTYQDPMPGSGLAACGYRIGSKVGPGIYDMPATSTSVVCHGTASTTVMIIMEIGPLPKACHSVGEAACKIETEAYDFAGNYTSASSTYNISAYDLSVGSSPTGIFITGDLAAYSSTTDYQILDIPSGTDIEVTAPATHIVGGTTYHFDNWAGDCGTTTNSTCELTMDGDKAVFANFAAGPFPPDNLQENWANCVWGLNQMAPSLGLTLSWDYNHPDGDPQAAYEIEISDLAGSSSIAAYPGPSTNQVLDLADFGTWKTTQCDHILEFSLFGNGLCWNTTYQWKVKVKDTNDNWSAWSNVKVTDDPTPLHAWPYPDFTWQPDPPRVGEITQFTDESEAYGGATTTNWWWQFENGNPASSPNKNPTTTFTTVTTMNAIDLEVWDDTGYHCPEHKDIGVFYPLPEYREVAPTGRLDNFLARLSNIFARF